MAQRVIFHVDANSAFLSWTAAYKVKVLGEELDIRDVPSVVAGDKESRRRHFPNILLFPQYLNLICRCPA